MTSQHVLRIRSLKDEIETLHLSYIQTEECLEKIRGQTRLEGIIKEYLSLTPHLEKFIFPVIATVLRNSISKKKDFNPFKLIAAWSALAKYAHNIVNQPWRKEFYSVQKYGGYFSHVIKDILVEWEKVFDLMGYTTCNDIMTLPEPPNIDNLIYVARDCFIAQVECKIIMKIYEEVLKIHNDCTWQDILEFRERHICSEEKAIAGLCSFFMRRDDDCAQDACINAGHPYDYPVLSSYQANPCMRYNEYKPISPYPNHVLGISPHLRMGHEESGYPHFVSPEYPYPNNCVKHLSTPFLMKDNGYLSNYHGGYGITYPNKTYYGNFIHSGNSQLVGLDERDHCSNCPDFNLGQIYPCYHGNNKFTERIHDSHRQRGKYLGKYENSIKQDSNDYQQRKNKDFVMPSNVKYAPISKNDLDDAMKAFAYDFDKNTVSDGEQYPEKSRKNNTHSDEQPASGVNSDKVKNNEAVGSDVWKCTSCTYHNSTKKKICEMCGKSRNAGNEIPLVSGGRQCPKCTLVNDKDAKTCEACSTDLKNSATYI